MSAKTDTISESPEAVILGAIAQELEQDPDLRTSILGPKLNSIGIPYLFLEIVCSNQNTCQAILWLKIVDGTLLATTTNSWQNAKRFILSDPNSLDKFQDLIKELKQSEPSPD